MSQRPSPTRVRYEQAVVDWRNELESDEPNWKQLEQLHAEMIRLEKILSVEEDNW